MNILTDEEIIKAIGGYLGQGTYRWTAEQLKQARAIEQAILERIGEPVAHCWMEDGDVKAFAFQDMPTFKPKYAPNAVSTPLFAIRGVE
jgi:hypothetical protein